MTNLIINQEWQNINQKEGKLIIITGPSGAGKDSLANAVMNKYTNIKKCVSTTTRASRMGEVEGKDYYFITRERFNELVNQEEFFEWIEYGTNLYGLQKTTVENDLSSRLNVLCILEVVGTKIVKNLLFNVVTIFIMPPSLEELEKRIRNRGLDNEDAIKIRMKRAREEIQEAQDFDYVITNDSFNKAFSELDIIISQVISS